LVDINWNFIGPLSSNECGNIVRTAHTIHAIGDKEIAEHLSISGDGSKEETNVFIQINLTGDEAMGGIECANWESNDVQRSYLMKTAQDVEKLPNIKLAGLMTAVPPTYSSAESRAIFQRTRAILDSVNLCLKDGPLKRLSMGMSSDFEIAIEEGASDVRIGSAIFKH